MMEVYKPAIGPEGQTALVTMEIDESGIDAVNIQDRTGIFVRRLGEPKYYYSGRINSATVTDIEELDPQTYETVDHLQTAYAAYNNAFEYEVGETVTADMVDLTTYAACAHGIHFFTTRERAIMYAQCSWFKSRQNAFIDELNRQEET